MARAIRSSGRSHCNRPQWISGSPQRPPTACRGDALVRPHASAGRGSSASCSGGRCRDPVLAGASLGRRPGIRGRGLCPDRARADPERCDSADRRCSGRSGSRCNDRRHGVWRTRRPLAGSERGRDPGAIVGWGGDLAAGSRCHGATCNLDADGSGEPGIRPVGFRDGRRSTGGAADRAARDSNACSTLGATECASLTRPSGRARARCLSSGAGRES